MLDVYAMKYGNIVDGFCGLCDEEDSSQLTFKRMHSVSAEGKHVKRLAYMKRHNSYVDKHGIKKKRSKKELSCDEFYRKMLHKGILSKDENPEERMKNDAEFALMYERECAKVKARADEVKANNEALYAAWRKQHGGAHYCHTRRAYDSWKFTEENRLFDIQIKQHGKDIVSMLIQEEVEIQRDAEAFLPYVKLSYYVGTQVYEFEEYFEEEISHFYLESKDYDEAEKKVAALYREECLKVLRNFGIAC